jgi:hypothetical protein
MILQPFLSRWRRCCDAPARGLGTQQVLLLMLLLISKSLWVSELLLEPLVGISPSHEVLEVLARAYVSASQSELLSVQAAMAMHALYSKAAPPEAPKPRIQACLRVLHAVASSVLGCMRTAAVEAAGCRAGVQRAACLIACGCNGSLVQIIPRTSAARASRLRLTHGAGMCSIALDALILLITICCVASASCLLWWFVQSAASAETCASLVVSHARRCALTWACHHHPLWQLMVVYVVPSTCGGSAINLVVGIFTVCVVQTLCDYVRAGALT